jgi:hypothetical protein
MRWHLWPLIIPSVFAGCIVLQLALGITACRRVKIGQVRSDNPRGYWLNILAQTIVAALITAFLLWKR